MMKPGLANTTNINKIDKTVVVHRINNLQLSVPFDKEVKINHNERDQTVVVVHETNSLQ